MPPTASVERHRRGAGTPIRGLDIDSVFDHFQRQTGRLGGIIGQHDGTRTGVEHHADPGAIDVGRNLEIAALRRAQVRRCGPGDSAAGHEFGQHAVGDMPEFVPIGVADHSTRAMAPQSAHRAHRLHKIVAKERITAPPTRTSAGDLDQHRAQHLRQCSRSEARRARRDGEPHPRPARQ